MAEGRLSTKGQVVIPKPVRVELGLRAGDRIEFTLHEGHAHLTKTRRDALDAFVSGPKVKWRRGEVEALLKDRHG